MNYSYMPSDLAGRLARLRPVAHALRDPYFEVVLRPIDASWHHAGITGAMGGFNPPRHCYYAARESAFSQWFATPETFHCPSDCALELAIDVLRFAHDYVHSWAYRLIATLLPDFHVATPRTTEALDKQAFFLVLSEAVAVVATDYWYLSLRGLKERCGTSFDLGPCTVHYRERYLRTYRKSNPSLTVQTPGLLDRIAWLYSTGEFEGFSEQDLLDNRKLADWMVRELLIAPRQRIVSRSWLSYLSGLAINDTTRVEKFRTLAQHHAALIEEIGHRVWLKVRHGRHDFIPIRLDQGNWFVCHDGPLDCRYANLNHVGTRVIDWAGGDVECWEAYMDQALSGHYLPTDPARRRTIASEVGVVRETFDVGKLGELLAILEPVPGIDPAPLELLFVN